MSSVCSLAFCSRCVCVRMCVCFRVCACFRQIAWLSIFDSRSGTSTKTSTACTRAVHGLLFGANLDDHLKRHLDCCTVVCALSKDSSIVVSLRGLPTAPCRLNESTATAPSEARLRRRWKPRTWGSCPSLRNCRRRGLSWPGLASRTKRWRSTSTSREFGQIFV